jgi:hypothetical protein
MSWLLRGNKAKLASTGLAIKASLTSSNHRSLSSTKQKEPKMTYVIAIRKNDGTINPMLTGRTYAPIAARMRAEQLNRERQAELVALGAESFVAFNLGAE